MIYVDIDPPISIKHNDVWYNPADLKTQKAIVVPSGLSNNSMITWLSLLATNAVPGSPKTGDVFVDASHTHLVPQYWDGFGWVPAVPSTFSFPTQLPRVGDAWTNSIISITYVWNGNKWVNSSQITLPPNGNPPPNKAFALLNNASGQQVMSITPNPSILKIYGPQGILVEIDTSSGNITYGLNYTPDAAAQTFWQALQTYSPVQVQNHITSLEIQLKDAQDVIKKLSNGGSNSKPSASLGGTTTGGAPTTANDAWDRAMKGLG